MDCVKVQKKILLGELANPKVRSHLEHCAECAIFADSLEKFVPAKPDETSFEVPPRIDDRIMSEARDVIDGRTPPHALDIELPHRNFASYFAMAATLILVSWLFVSLLIPKNAVDEGSSGNVSGAVARIGNGSSASLMWNDQVVDSDFLTIDTDIEFTFALMKISADEDVDDHGSDDSEGDDRFNVVIPDILT